MAVPFILLYVIDTNNWSPFFSFAIRNQLVQRVNAFGYRISCAMFYVQGRVFWLLVDKGGLLLCCISKTIVCSNGLYQLLGPLAEHA